MTVRIGPRTAAATVGDGTFAVPTGELAFAPGSSGWTRPDGTALAWYELLLRGGNAAEVFGFPAAGSRVEVSPQET